MLKFGIVYIAIVVAIIVWGRIDRRIKYNAASKPQGWGDSMPWRPEIKGDRGFYIFVICVAVLVGWIFFMLEVF